MSHCRYGRSKYTYPYEFNVGDKVKHILTQREGICLGESKKYKKQLDIQMLDKQNKEPETYHAEELLFVD